MLGVVGASLFYGYTDTKSRYEVFPSPQPPGGAIPPVAFADFKDEGGRLLPRKMEVRVGDRRYAQMNLAVHQMK